MGGASVKSGKREVKFPPQIKARNDPIVINTPPAFYPEIPGKKQTMQPTIIVPEIVYPEKKKQMIVHHPVSRFGQYNNMFYNKVNPAFMGMAAGNPYWQGFLSNNQAFQDIKQDANYKEGMKEMQGIIPESKSKKFVLV
jgi:hypothetical protein